MDNEESIIRHLPPKLAEIKELADIQYAIDPELRDILSIMIKVLNNRFPQLADRDGIEEWEDWLGIVPNPNKSLDERRTDVLIKMNSRIPYTKVQLHRILAAAVGWDNYSFTIENFTLLVEIAFDQYDKLQAVRDILDQIVPAHILRQATSYIQSQEDVGVGSAYTYGNEITIYPYSDNSPINQDLNIGAIGIVEIYREIEIGS